MVDFLGCVYVDIDQRYFNDVSGPGGFATIDIEPGYQKLCGQDALDYVRYRHTDNDLVARRRQQDFLRQMLRQTRRPQAPELRQAQDAGEDRRPLHDDRQVAALKTTQLFSLLKLGLAVADKPIQEVPFGAGRIEDDGTSYLTASQDALDETVDDFLNARAARPAAASKLEPTDAGEAVARASAPERSKPLAASPGSRSRRARARTRRSSPAPKLDFPFYFPTLRRHRVAATSATVAARYTIRDELGAASTAPTGWSLAARRRSASTTASRA